RTWCVNGRLAWVPGARSGQRLVRRSDLTAFLARRAEQGPIAERELEGSLDASSALARASASASEPASLSGIRDQLAGGVALRRLAGEVSGRLDLDTIFADVVADAMS